MVSTELGIDPDAVLDWRETKLALWGTVSGRCTRERMLLENSLLTLAVWAPKKLREVLKGAQGPMDKEKIRKALQQAERVSKMNLRPATAEDLKNLKKRKKE